MFKKIGLMVVSVAALTACEASMKVPDQGLVTGDVYTDMPLSAGACDELGALMRPGLATTHHGLGRLEASAAPVR